MTPDLWAEALAYVAIWVLGARDASQAWVLHDEGERGFEFWVLALTAAGCLTCGTLRLLSMFCI